MHCFFVEDAMTKISFWILRENPSKYKMLKVLLHLMAVCTKEQNKSGSFFLSSKWLYCKSFKIDINTYIKTQNINATQIKSF